MTQSPIDNLFFEYAVEESVIRFHKTPDDIRNLFLPLGSPSYKIRSEYQSKLVQQTDIKRWLFWGRHFEDKEISMRCNSILRKITPCITCKSSGKSVNWSSFGCDDCHGNGYYWGLSPWD